MAELKIRDINVNDKEEYFGMFKELYDSVAVIADYKEEIAELNFNNAIDSSAKQIRCLIFEYKDIILGYAFLSFSYATDSAAKYISLEELYIKGPARGKGVGSYFIDWLFKEYKDQVKSIKLEVARENSAAIKFYKKLKFEENEYMHMHLDME